MKRITIFILAVISINVYSQLTEYKSYYDNGKIKECGYYSENELKTGEWKGYY